MAKSTGLIPIFGLELVGIAILNLQKCKVYCPKSVQAEQKHHPNLFGMLHRADIGQNVFNLLVIYKFAISHCLSPFERLRLKGNKVRNLSVAFICLVSRLLGRKPYISADVSLWRYRPEAASLA